MFREKTLSFSGRPWIRKITFPMLNCLVAEKHQELQTGSRKGGGQRKRREPREVQGGRDVVGDPHRERGV